MTTRIAFFTVCLLFLNACGGRATQRENATHDERAEQSHAAESAHESADHHANESDSDADAERWHSLFDGKELGAWESTKFGGEGEVLVENGVIVLSQGNNMTGITWKGDLPFKINYEIEYKALRDIGHDFFGTITFPVNENPLSFVLGGWGGSILGLSNLSFFDASDNESTKILGLESKRWYTVRLRVEKKRITSWLDGDQLFSVDISEHDIGIRPEVELNVPLGFSTFTSTGHIKDIRWRRIEPGEFDVEDEY